jgi:hypothetical protein
MSAGLPGLGLGGLFFIFSALLAPFRQLWRSLRGRARPGEWWMVGRQFAQAVLMVAAIDLTLRLTYLALSVTGLADAPSALSGTVLPLTLIGITTGLLLAVLCLAKLAELAVRLRTAELPRVPDVLPRAVPLRALGLGGALALAWVALLATGASELSPLVEPRGGRGAAEPQTAPLAGRPRPEPASPAAVTPEPADPPNAQVAAASPSPSPSRSTPQSRDREPPAGGRPTVRPAVSIPAPQLPATTAPPAPGKSPVVTPASGGQPPAASEVPATVPPAPPAAPAAEPGPPPGSPAPESAGPPEGVPGPGANGAPAALENGSPPR